MDETRGSTGAAKQKGRGEGGRRKEGGGVVLSLEGQGKETGLC